MCINEWADSGTLLNLFKSVNLDGNVQNAERF